MANPAVPHLVATQRPDGGWGPYPGTPSRTEATALAAVALARAEDADPALDAAAERAVAWLREQQRADGAWPVAPDVPEAAWCTSLATLALSHFGSGAEAAGRGARWLLRQEGQGAPWWTRLLFRLAPSRKPVDIDPELTGWPWVDGTFSWVEPTAYAMLALKRAGGAEESARVASRMEEARRMLVDRACPGGGWNYGNSRVFGEDLWPYPDTTALVLLALADRREMPAVAEGISALRAMMEENDSLLSLGLGGLALAAHGGRDEALIAALAGRVAAWEGGEIRTLAWAALGLAASTDPLGVAGA